MFVFCTILFVVMGLKIKVMDIKNSDIKTAILEAALPNIPFEGWVDEALENAALSCGYSKSMVNAVFPNGVKDAIIFFSYWADEKMLEKLRVANAKDMRIRDKITIAVRARLDVLAPFKEAEKLAIAYWMRPLRKFEGIKLVWKTADKIWDWAGDTATDYNRYTKRVLLSGVLTSTTFFWMNDHSPHHKDTDGFLERRIENVMSIGKITSKFKTVRT